MKRGSFFERLTGSGHYFDQDAEAIEEKVIHKNLSPRGSNLDALEEDDAGELSVDVFQTPDCIVIEAMISAVRPDQLDISITR